MPITRQPRIFAICTAVDPVAPAAAETATVSPSRTCPTSVSPTYAVMPALPKTLSSASGSASSASTVVSIGSSPTTANCCQPVNVATNDPAGTFSLFVSTTRPIPLQRTTSPISTGGM